MDPDVAFSCKHYVVRSTSNLVPLVQSMSMVKCGQTFEQNLDEDTMVYHQELMTWSPLIESFVHGLPMKPRFVRGDGMLIWSLTSLLVRQNAVRVNRSTKLGWRLMSDSDVNVKF